MSRTHVALDVPAATRAQPTGWRDPRLWVGVAIVAASIIAGARIVGAADDTVTVWAAADDLAPGDTLREDDLRATAVRFEETAALAGYLQTSKALPADLHLTRGLSAGELVPVAALGSSQEADTVIVSLAFPRELVPTNIGAGSTIELLVIPEDTSPLADTGARGKAGDDAPTTVLEDVVVIDAPSSPDSLGGVGGSRQLVLGLPETDPAALGEVLAASEDQRVRILVRG